MKAKKEGRDAWIDGLTENPYPKGTLKHTYWNAGYALGKRELPWAGPQKSKTSDGMYLVISADNDNWLATLNGAKEVRGVRLD